MRAHGLPRARWLFWLAVFGTGLLVGLLIAHSRGPISTSRSRVLTPAVSSATEPEGVDRPGRRSQQAAVAAAAADTTMLARLIPMNPADARGWATRHATPQFAPHLAEGIRTDLATLQEPADLQVRMVYRQSVLAVRVTAWTTACPAAARSCSLGVSARIPVWTLLTISASDSGEGQANAMAAFSLVTVDLLWSDDSWQISGLSEAAGPSPLVVGLPVSGPGRANARDGFRDWRPL